MSKKNKKVLICAPPLNGPGGVANYYRVVRRYLKPEDGVDFFEHGSDSSGIGVVWAMFMEPLRFLSKLARKRYALVHLNPSLQPKSVVRYAGLLLLAKAFGLKTIVFWRGWDKDLEERIADHYSKLFTTVFNMPNLNLVLAEEFRQRLTGLGVRPPILVTSVITDTKLALEPGSLPEKPMALMFMSRLVASKGIRETIESFAILCSEFPDLRLEVAGDGPEKAALEKEFAGLEGLCFHGHVGDKEKYRLMAGCNVFVFPTNHAEGMPNCVLEAMAAGLPVITRSVGGIRDFFRHGEHGFLVESSDSRELAKVTAGLLRDRQIMERISEHNRRYAEENFSASRVTAFLKRVYTSVLEGDVSDLPGEWYADHSGKKKVSLVESIKPKVVN